MIRAGQIYFCKKYQFDDGSCSDKLFVILNTPPNGKIPYIFCLTTKVFWHKPQTPGCYSEYGYYVIEKDHDWFNIKTWLELYRTEEFINAQFNEKVNDGTFTLMSSLRKDTANSIINCAIRCDDISNYKIDIIKECKACDTNLK